MYYGKMGWSWTELYALPTHIRSYYYRKLVDIREKENKSEQSEAVGKNEIDYLTQKAQDNAEYYATRMQDYLIAYSTQIPEFLESVGNSTQIYPDQSNQYFGGINL